MIQPQPQKNTSGLRILLENRPFLLLWFGQLLSQVADKVFFILLIALLENYHSPGTFANSMRSTSMVAFTLPAIFFGSAAGIAVDRFSKKQVMIAADGIRAFLILLIPILPRQFLILLAVTFLISTATQFFAPAEQAAIPLLVNRESLLAANALFTTTVIGSLIVGFAIGEPLLSWVKTLGGENGEVIFVAGLYIVAVVSRLFITIKETPLHHTSNKHPWSDFKEGLSYLWNNRFIRNAMLQLTILYSAFAAITVLAISLAQRIGLKPTQFGFLLAAAGVGLLFGAGAIGQWGGRFSRFPLPLLGFLIMAFVLSLFTFIKDIGLGLGLSTLFGLGASLVGVPMQTVIQASTPESMRGKVFGFQNNLVNIALSLPLAITGPLTDSFGLRTVLIAMSVIITVIAFWAWHNTPTSQDIE